MGLAQLVGELLEPLGAARDEHDVVAALGELAREVGADPGGRAGDQDGRAVRGRRESHASIPTPSGALDSRPLRASRCPPRHRFPLAKYPLLRAAGRRGGLAAPEEIHETEPSRGRCSSASTTAALLARIRDGELSVREQRGLGLPWSPELVERGRRSVARHGGGGAPRARARGRDEPRRRHPPRRPRLRARLLPLQRRRRALAELRARRPRAAGAGGRLRRPPGRRHRRPARPATRDAFTLSLHGARNYPFQRIPSDLDVDLADRAPATRDYLEALDGALDEALARCEPDDRVLPRRRRPVGGRPPRPPRAHQAGLRARDELVLDRLRAARRAVCVVLAGGYAEDVRDTVDINAADRRGRRRPPWRRGESNPYLSLAKAACSRYHYAPGGVPRIDARLGSGDGHASARPPSQPPPRSRTTTSSTTGSTLAADRLGPARRPPRGHALLLPRGAGADPGHARPTGRSTSSPATASSTTARAGRTRAASATTPRSTSTRCARSPR